MSRTPKSQSQYFSRTPEDLKNCRKKLQINHLKPKNSSLIKGLLSRPRSPNWSTLSDYLEYAPRVCTSSLVTIYNLQVAISCRNLLAANYVKHNHLRLGESKKNPLSRTISP